MLLLLSPTTAIVNLFKLKCRDRKGLGDASGIGEGDLGGVRIINGDIGYGDPDEELLGLDTCKSPHPTLLDEGRDLRIVGNDAADCREPVLLHPLLLEPDEAGGAVVSDFDDVVEWEESTRQSHVLEDLAGLLLADGLAVVDLGVTRVV